MMQVVWFISDPHFGHKRIIEYEKRPFVDTEHMDNHIIESYNHKIKDGDIVFWLGDMFFCNSSRMNYICQRLNLSKARNILIRGNHDKGVSDTKFMKLGFLPFRMYNFGSMILTHEPMSENNLDILSQYKIMKNVHGHTHGTETGLDPYRWQCVSMEKTSYEPIMWIDVFNRFREGWSGKDV